MVKKKLGNTFTLPLQLPPSGCVSVERESGLVLGGVAVVDRVVEPHVRHSLGGVASRRASSTYSSSGLLELPKVLVSLNSLRMHFVLMLEFFPLEFHFLNFQLLFEFEKNCKSCYDVICFVEVDRKKN